MILTYKLRHNRDSSDELTKAFAVAEFAVRNPTCRSSAAVKEIGLKSAISNQILKKYGNQKTIKQVRNVNLVVPGQSIKVDTESKTIRVVPLKLTLHYRFPEFVKVNQIEIDADYAYVSCTVIEEPEMIPRRFIGVDRNTTGHVAVAANPDTGKIEKLGKKAIHTHRKYSAIRKRLQKRGKFRKLKAIKDRESRIVKDLNHKISRKVVDMAKDQDAALVFEDLNGIRKTRKQHRSFNYALHSWSFYQLQQFVEYKAKLLGVPVLYIDPAYTSQECSRCGVRGQRRGKEFKCPVCGHVDHADVNAAFNIALRQKGMVDRVQKEMYTMGVLIPHDAMLEECQATSEPHAL
ncbi:MAG TPA: transposase [Methanoculleus sp.]|nr:transposase [Methanoculleus sp.]